MEEKRKEKKVMKIRNKQWFQDIKDKKLVYVQD